MGAVYRARRKHIGDEVAIKVLLDKFVAGNEATERFRREARAAAMLRHPNVVAIYDFSDGAGPVARLISSWNWWKVNASGSVGPGGQNCG